MGPTGLPETSVRNYHYMLRKIQKERRSHLLSGESLKSRKILQRWQQTNFRRNKSMGAYKKWRPQEYIAHLRQQCHNSKFV